MNLKNRQRILAVARFLDRRAAGLRKYVQNHTPKRPRKVSPT